MRLSKVRLFDLGRKIQSDSHGFLYSSSLASSLPNRNLEDLFMRKASVFHLGWRHSLKPAFFPRRTGAARFLIQLPDGKLLASTVVRAAHLRQVVCDMLVGTWTSI